MFRPSAITAASGAECWGASGVLTGGVLTSQSSSERTKNACSASSWAGRTGVAVGAPRDGDHLSRLMTSSRTD
jgi:hypothetical protein